MLNPTELNSQADMRIAFAMQEKDLNKRIYNVAYALTGLGDFCLEKENGSGHEYAQMLQAAYRFHKAKPDSGIAQYLGYALDVIAEEQDNPIFAFYGKDIFRTQLENQNNGTAAITVEPARLQKLLAEPVKEEAPVSVQPPVQPEVKAPVKAEKPEKKKHTGLIAAAAAVVLVLASIYPILCLVHHNKGNSLLEEGELVLAAEEFAKDPLFSRNADRVIKDKAMVLGRAAYAEKNYHDAIFCFRYVGDEAESELADALYDSSVDYIAEGKYELAIKQLSEIKDEQRAKEQLSVARLAVARGYMEKGDYDQAREYTQQIELPDFVDVDSFLTEVYHTEGVQRVGEDDLAAAESAFLSCTDDEIANANLNIVQDILNGRAFAAAVGIDEGKSDVAANTWEEIFRNHFDNTPADLAEALDIAGGSAILNGTLTAEAPEEMAAQINSRFEDTDKIGQYTGTIWDDIERVGVGTVSELVKQCPGSDSGKFLIVHERSKLNTHEKSAAVMLDVMRTMPRDKFPATLEEVQYIVVIRTDYQDNGFYTRNSQRIPGCKEYVSVSVINAATGGTLFTSTTAFGEPAPDHVTDTGADHFSGKCPDITDIAAAALKKVM